MAAISMVLVLCACGGEGSTDEPPVIVSPACDVAYPGPAMLDGIVENGPSVYAAIDATAIRSDFTADISGVGDLQRAVIAYMIAKPGAVTVTAADLEAAGLFGKAVAYAYRGGSLDFTELRIALHAVYPCASGVPATLQNARDVFGDYYTWPTTDIACSAPKDGVRRIWTNDQLGIFVAETIAEDNTVRETEILFGNLRSDGQLTFAAYTSDGFFMDRSTFATAGGEALTLAAPYTCITCHVNEDMTAIDDPLPIGTGAGCNSARFH